jgi:hypothetical protein
MFGGMALVLARLASPLDPKHHPLKPGYFSHVTTTDSMEANRYVQKI